MVPRGVLVWFVSPLKTIAKKYSEGCKGQAYRLDSRFCYRRSNSKDWYLITVLTRHFYCGDLQEENCCLVTVVAGEVNRITDYEHLRSQVVLRRWMLSPLEASLRAFSSSFGPTWDAQYSIKRRAKEQ